MNRIYLLLLLGFGLAACTGDFEEINTDPNRPTDVPTSYLITQAQRALVDRVVGEGFAGLGTFGMHYIQHLSQTQYTDVTRYDNIETDFSGFYTGGLADLKTVIDLNEGESTKVQASTSGPNANQIAIAKIMMGWSYLSMTDFWGDIPYSEALKGLENISPVYDAQEDIYRGVVASLTEAGDMIVAGSVEGDIIFGGDMELWRKFANSLILRAGIRVADVAGDLGRGWVTTALSRGVMTSNDDNALLNYIGGGEFSQNTFFTDAITRTDYAISKPLVDRLDELNDPRVAVYAQPTQNSVDAGDPEYVGMIYGITEGDAGAIPTAQVSFPGLFYTGATAPGILLTYHEVLFNMAEAAQRGWTDGDAEELYDAAITASMNFNGIDDGDAIEDYLDQDMVSYDSDNWRMSIGEQKWIGLYFQGMEAWSEWRRLGFPELTPAPEAILTTEIPRRRGYPVIEFSLNEANYTDALERQFGGMNTLDGRVWWDVN